MVVFFFFFQAEDGIRDVAVTGVQTCALPIFFFLLLEPCRRCCARRRLDFLFPLVAKPRLRTSFQARAHRKAARGRDRKSTRLNSSHGYISYAVFCLKKKKVQTRATRQWTMTHRRRYMCSIDK